MGERVPAIQPQQLRLRLESPNPGELIVTICAHTPATSFGQHAGMRQLNLLGAEAIVHAPYAPAHLIQQASGLKWGECGAAWLGF